MAEKQQKTGKAVLIYDGNCPICQRAVEWIKGNKRKDSFEMLPCQSEEVRRRFPLIEESICMGAMQLILPDGQVLSGESALPEILGRLKRYRLAAGLFRLPGSKILAGSFYRWFGGKGVNGGKGVKSLFLNNLVYSLRKKLRNPDDLHFPLHFLEILVPGD